jgi:hypothetical protein
VGLFKRIRNVARNVVGTVTGIGPASKLVQKATSGGVLFKVKKVVRKAAAIDQGIKTAGLVKPKVVRIRNERSVAIFKQAAQASQAVAVAAVTGAGVKGVVEAVAPAVLQSFAPAEAGEDFAWNPEGEGGVPDSFLDFYRKQSGGPILTDPAPKPGLSPVLALVSAGVGIYLLTKGG